MLINKRKNIKKITTKLKIVLHNIITYNYCLSIWCEYNGLSHSKRYLSYREGRLAL